VTFFEIGYSAFIGPDHYFVVCPNRFGRLQWYAFVKTPPLMAELANPKAFLDDTFKNWSLPVRELILASKDDEIIQRDLLDRAPSIQKSWASNFVTLIGDSCHATMPNIGQGTGLAFEDGYVLADMLSTASTRADIPQILQRFYRKRIFRTATVQGLGRLNSEAIKLLTPFLFIRPVVNFLLSPLLPSVFYLQFLYCYSFCPSKISSQKSMKIASLMQLRHVGECKQAWRQNRQL
jgi:2-polyprenyl-6-methoxyphenol hydroxylase-like FAD-dependent oxidoreductase